MQHFQQGPHISPLKKVHWSFRHEKQGISSMRKHYKKAILPETPRYAYLFRVRSFHPGQSAPDAQQHQQLARHQQWQLSPTFYMQLWR